MFLFINQRIRELKKKQHNRTFPEITKGSAALVKLTQCYLNGLLDPFISLLEVHKLMYFMQESGEDLRLKYVKGYYGLYAENFSDVFNAIEGHLILGYSDGVYAPQKALYLAPNAIHEASNFLTQYPDTRARFDKVADLVAGFESSFGLELLSSVHWVMKEDAAQTAEEIINHIYAWNPRKKQFTPRQIVLAMDVLKGKGWI
jgi:hypothetical protein